MSFTIDPDQIKLDSSRIAKAFKRVEKESDGLFELTSVFYYFESEKLYGYLIRGHLMAGFGIAVSSQWPQSYHTIESRTDEELYRYADHTYLRWKRIISMAEQWGKQFASSNGDMRYKTFPMVRLVRTKQGYVLPENEVDPSDVEADFNTWLGGIAQQAVDAINAEDAANTDGYSSDFNLDNENDQE